MFDDRIQRGYDFVLIIPDFNLIVMDGPNAGAMVNPCYMRPVTEAANDFINMAYKGHKRGLGNSLVFTNVDKFHDALEGLSACGLTVQIL